MKVLNAPQRNSRQCANLARNLSREIDKNLLEGLSIHQLSAPRPQAIILAAQMGATFTVSAQREGFRSVAPLRLAAGPFETQYPTEDSSTDPSPLAHLAEPERDGRIPQSENGSVHQLFRGARFCDLTEVAEQYARGLQKHIVAD